MAGVGIGDFAHFFAQARQLAFLGTGEDLHFAPKSTYLAHWGSKHSERVTAFAPWGKNVVDHLGADGANNVALSVGVHDLAAMKKALTSPELKVKTRLT